MGAGHADHAVAELQALENHLNPASPKGTRVGAPSFVEAGRTWSALRDVCQNRLDPAYLNPANIEELYLLAESLIYGDDRHIGYGDRGITIGDNVYDFTYIEEMLALWTWKVYHRLPAVDDAAMRSPYAKLFRSILEHHLGNRLTIITTNYDLVAEYTALVSTDDCQCKHRNPRGWTVTNVDEEDRIIDSREIELPICKLHGSIDLFTGIVDGTPALIRANTLDKSSNLGDGWKFAVLQVNSLHKLKQRWGTSLTPAIVPPTFAKSRRYDWIDSEWRLAHRAIRQTRHLLFLGYSMPPSDGGTRGLIGSALLANGNSPAVYVGNSCAQTVDMYKQRFAITDPRKALAAKFEDMDDAIDKWFSDMANT